MEEHKCDRRTLRWLAIAWAKEEGLVPHSLNRADLHGREIPSWTSGMLWDLHTGSDKNSWHSRWRTLFAGVLKRAGAETTPITARVATKDVHRGMCPRRAADLPSSHALLAWQVLYGLEPARPSRQSLGCICAPK